MGVEGGMSSTPATVTPSIAVAEGVGCSVGVGSAGRDGVSSSMGVAEDGAEPRLTFFFIGDGP